MCVAITYNAFHGDLSYESAIMEREIKYFAQSSISFYDIWAFSRLVLYAYMDFCHWTQDAFGSIYFGGMLTTYTQKSKVNMGSQFVVMFPSNAKNFEDLCNRKFGPPGSEKW